MINLTVNKTIKIYARFTADEWCLYTASLEKDHVDRCANHLNGLLEYYVNSGMVRKDVEGNLHYTMKRIEWCGAYDTEARKFLTTVLNEIYGE